MKTSIKLTFSLLLLILTSSMFSSVYADDLSLKITDELNAEVKDTKNTAIESFKHKVLSSKNMFLEDGVWYTYVFNNYVGFGKGVNPTKNMLVSSKLNFDKDLLLLDVEQGYGFVTNYTKVKLVSDYIISDISNKEQFLIELSGEKKYFQKDSDKDILSLKNDVLALTKGLTENEKVVKVYNYIIQNVKYSSKFSASNYKIFSGLQTYLNSDGICEGYSRLYLYMLSFAGVDGVSVVRGNVLNTKDFLSIGHAWNKIGSSYYDLTFDDTVLSEKNKTTKNYKYFSLPKDLFYADRYEYGTLPKNLEDTTLSYRKNLVNETLKSLSKKYESYDYNLLKQYKKVEVSYN